MACHKHPNVRRTDFLILLIKIKERDPKMATIEAHHRNRTYPRFIYAIVG
jgi:hypothetical protein